MRPGRVPAEMLNRLDTDDIVLLVCRLLLLESLTIIILNYKHGECAHSSPARQPLSAWAVPDPASPTGPGPSALPRPPSCPVGSIFQAVALKRDICLCVLPQTIQSHLRYYCSPLGQAREYELVVTCVRVALVI